MHASIVALTVATALCVGACQRSSDPPGSGASADSNSPAAAPPDSGLPEAAAQPVLHWECDGGAVLTTKYLPRDRAIAVGLHEGERKLSQVVAASGEKYQEGPITFWRKGDTASYQRAPAPAIACRLASG